MNGTHITNKVTRILIGDNGSYIECSPDSLDASKLRTTKSGKWFITKFIGGAKVYVQKIGVEKQPNPPPYGKYWCCYDRQGGYADYRPGKAYISLDDVSISTPGGDLCSLKSRELAKVLENCPEYMKWSRKSSQRGGGG